MLKLNTAGYSAAALSCATFFCLDINAHAETGNISGNQFNPAISLILDGRYSQYHDDFELPGVIVGPEAELPSNGFSLGHSELTISANVDDVFYGSTSLAFHEHDGETEVELEEAYLETLGLGHGASIKFGRFLSNIGYMNSQHEHAWTFYDSPLIYNALFGKALYDDGVQLRWLAPTDVYLEFGAEFSRGERFPGGTSTKGNQGRALFAKIGSDLGNNASWQLGLSSYTTAYDQRSSEDHHHEETDHEAEFLLQNGDVQISGVDGVFKWAPTGNPQHQQWVLQAEYFEKDEEAEARLEEHSDAGDASILNQYDGVLSGYYAQIGYRFHPRWRTAIRYEAIEPDNQFTVLQSDGIDPDEFLEETELGSDETITRNSIMLEYNHSEFSRIRLQYNHSDWSEDRDDLWLIQYTMSLGSHGAHQY